VDLTDPTTTTILAAAALDAAGIASAVYGGLALAAYGEARETKDADFAVAAYRVDDVVRALAATSSSPSVSFERMRFGGLEITRIALFGSGDATGFNVVNLVEPRSRRYAEGVRRRALVGALRGVRVTLVAPEDFVLLEVLSSRERDLEDAASVVASLGSSLALEQVNREAAALSAEVADHDVRGRLLRVLELASAQR
jgi:hypothetical protein